MPPKCSVCCDPRIKEINEACVRGTESLRSIALRMNITPSSMLRHSKHLPKAIVKAKEVKEVAQADNLLRYAKGILAKSISFMNQAEAAGDLRTACSAVREARACTELLMRATGELDTRNQTSVQVNVSTPSMQQSPEWPIVWQVLGECPSCFKKLADELERRGL